MTSTWGVIISFRCIALLLPLPDRGVLGASSRIHPFLTSHLSAAVSAEVPQEAWRALAQYTRVPCPSFCKLHTTGSRWRAAATTIVARNHTGAGTDEGRVGVLGLGPVVRHLCQRADRLKVREAVSLWDSGPRTVLLAACRALRACSAVPRVRGAPWHKPCWRSQTETSL